MKISLSFFLIIFLISIPFTSTSQCERIAKSAIKDLFPFRFNGQLSNVVLSEVESAKLNIVFSGGTKYRILSKGVG